LKSVQTNPNCKLQWTES